MKKLIAWLCVLALLLCLVSFVGCKKTPPEGGDESTEQTPGGNPGGDPGTGTPETPGGPTEGPSEVQGGNDPYVPDQEW